MVSAPAAPLLEAVAREADRPTHPGTSGHPFDRYVGRELLPYVLLMLDAGLRSGEALGLRWRSVVWGQSDDDPRRHLLIEESRPRGGALGRTKSGRSRRVALSRRLRDVLFALYRERRAPPPDAHILTTKQATLWEAWGRAVIQAGIGHIRRKDLRDTFASQLLTSGVQLGYVSRQLGHADFGVTVRHYAKWCGDDQYRSPVSLESGEVPADLLGRLEKSPQFPPTWLSANDEGNLEGFLAPSSSRAGRGWLADQDSKAKAGTRDPSKRR